MTKKLNYLVSLLIIIVLIGSGALIYFFATKKDQDSATKYYTVTFYSTNLDKLQVEEGSAISSPNAVKAGYKIDSWYKDAQLSKEWNFTSDKVDSNITLYPKWIEDYVGIVLAKNNIKVSYNKGDEDISTLGLTVWLERSDGYRKIVNQYEVIDGRADDGNKAGVYNITIKHGDFSNSYKIRVMPSENEFLVEAYVNDSLYYSEYLLSNYDLELNEPVAEDYEFAGWYYTSDFISETEASIPTIVNNNITVYAKMLKKLKVTFANSDISTLNKLYGNTISLEDVDFKLTEENNNFVGWSKSNSIVWKSVKATALSEEPSNYHLTGLEERIVNENLTEYYSGSRLVYKKENIVWTSYVETTESGPVDVSGLEARRIDDLTATIIGYYDGEIVVYKKYMGVTETNLTLTSDVTLYPVFYTKQMSINFLYEDSLEPFETKIIGFGEKVGKLPLPEKLSGKGFTGYYFGETLVTEDYVFDYTAEEINLVAKYEDEVLLDASFKSPISKYTQGATVISNNYYFVKFDGTAAEIFAYNISESITIEAEGQFEFKELYFNYDGSDVKEVETNNILTKVESLYKYINGEKTYYFKISGSNVIVFEEMNDAVVSIENGLVYVTVNGKLVRGTQLSDTRNADLFKFTNFLVYIDLSGYKGYGLYNERGEALTKAEFVWDNVNVNIYAKYNKEVTISYNANGGSIVDKNFVGYEGMPFGNLSTPTRAGYVFDGWYLNLTDANKITSNNIIPVGTKTIYAKWIKSVEVEVNFYTTSKTTAFTTIKFFKGHEYLSLPTVNIQYYQFEGWFLDEAFTMPVFNTSIVDGSTKLYAKLIAYEFTAKINYGVTGIGNGEMQFAIGGIVSGLPAVENLNYAFGGWYTSESFSSSSYIYNGMKVTAVFDNIYLKVTPISSVFISSFKGDSNIIEIRDMQGASFKLPAQSQTKAGFLALGYFEDLNGNGEYDEDSETLYAKGTSFSINDTDRYFYYLYVRTVKIYHEYIDGSQKGTANLVNISNDNFNELYGDDYLGSKSLYGSDNRYTVTGFYVDFNGNGKYDTNEINFAPNSAGEVLYITFEDVWHVNVISGSGATYNVSKVNLGLDGKFSHGDYNYLWNGSTKLQVYSGTELIKELTNKDAKFTTDGVTFQLPYNLYLYPIYTENFCTFTFYESVGGDVFYQVANNWYSYINPLTVSSNESFYYKGGQIYVGWFVDENNNGIYDEGEGIFSRDENIYFANTDENLYPLYKNYLTSLVYQDGSYSVFDSYDNNNVVLPPINSVSFWYIDYNQNQVYDDGELRIEDYNLIDGSKTYQFSYNYFNTIQIYNSSNYIPGTKKFLNNQFQHEGYTYKFTGYNGTGVFVIEIYDSENNLLPDAIEANGIFEHNGYTFRLPLEIRSSTVHYVRFRNNVGDVLLTVDTYENETLTIGNDFSHLFGEQNAYDPNSYFYGLYYIDSNRNDVFDAEDVIVYEGTQIGITEDLYINFYYLKYVDVNFNGQLYRLLNLDSSNAAIGYIMNTLKPYEDNHGYEFFDNVTSENFVNVSEVHYIDLNENGIKDEFEPMVSELGEGSIRRYEDFMPYLLSGTLNLEDINSTRYNITFIGNIGEGIYETFSVSENKTFTIGNDFSHLFGEHYNNDANSYFYGLYYIDYNKNDVFDAEDVIVHEGSQINNITEDINVCFYYLKYVDVYVESEPYRLINVDSLAPAFSYIMNTLKSYEGNHVDEFFGNVTSDNFINFGDYYTSYYIDLNKNGGKDELEPMVSELGVGSIRRYEDFMPYLFGGPLVIKEI